MTKPTCKLIGTDGNAFAIIGKVSTCLKKAGMKDEAEVFVNYAFAAESYDEMLRICTQYVDIV